MEAQITNPYGALSTIDDHRTGQDQEGLDIMYGFRGNMFRANATITKGQALMWVGPTATVPVSVTPMTAAADPWRFAGVAMSDAAADESLLVAHQGVVIIKFDGGSTAAADDAVILPATTTGEFDILAGAQAINEDLIGNCLAVEIGTTETCLAAIGLVPNNAGGATT